MKTKFIRLFIALALLALPALVQAQFNVTITNNGNILIQFSGGVPEVLYAIEESSNLLTWTVAATDTADAMGSFSFQDAATAGVSTRFYRAVRAFTVGGIILTGPPAGDTVTLQNNGSDNQTLGGGSGTFTFPAALPDGSAYSVTVRGVYFGGLTPTTCTITNGRGTISGANVTNVLIQCRPFINGDYLPITGTPDVDMLNAAVADETAHGGVPGVMRTLDAGSIRVTANAAYSHRVVLFYYPWARTTFTVGSNSCSSTSFTNGTEVIEFGTAVACQPDELYGY